MEKRGEGKRIKINLVGTLTVSTAPEPFCFGAEESRDKRLEEEEEERMGTKKEREKDLQVRGFLFNFTDVTLALEDDKSPISPLLE